MTDASKKFLRILLIDDDPENGDVLELAQEDWSVLTLLSPDPIFEGEVDVNDFDLVAVDLVIHPNEQTRNSFVNVSPEVGYQTLRWLIQHYPEKPVVVMSALLEDFSAEAEFKSMFPGITYFKKPFDAFDASFRLAVENITKEGKLRRE